MNTKQTIAVIGAECDKGMAIIKALSRGNYRFLLFSEEAGRLNDLMQSIQTVSPGLDIEELKCTTDACWEADIIFLAVPFAELEEVASNIRNVSSQKIVILLSSADQGDSGYKKALTQLQSLLPHSKIISTHLDSDITKALIEGTDEESLQFVAEIIQEAGIVPVVAVIQL